MKAILKVIRCNRHRFRFGIHLTEKEIHLIGIRTITLYTEECKQISIEDINSFQRYQSIIDREIGDWIVQEGWVHEKRKPMKLVKFDLRIEGKTLEFRCIGPSNFRKVPNKRKYILEGTPAHNAERFEDEINTIWNDQIRKR